MADIERSAQAVWTGPLRGGSGTIETQSGTVRAAAYSAVSRFEQGPGTNPEELLAAAHAACYSMALSATLSRQGHNPERIETRAICHLTPQSGGYKVTKMHLETRGSVPGMDAATFKQMAQAAEASCPISNTLRGNVEIELDAMLL